LILKGLWKSLPLYSPHLIAAANGLKRIAPADVDAANDPRKGLACSDATAFCTSVLQHVRRHIKWDIRAALALEALAHLVGLNMQ